MSRRVVRVLHDIDLALHAGESAPGIVGESRGSGEATTLARILVGLHPLDAGTATFDGCSLALPATKRPLELRRNLQIVFQNPEMAFNPRLRIGAVLGHGLRLFEGRAGSAATRARSSSCCTRWGSRRRTRTSCPRSSAAASASGPR